MIYIDHHISSSKVNGGKKPTEKLNTLINQSINQSYF